MDKFTGFIVHSKEHGEINIGIGKLPGRKSYCVYLQEQNRLIPVFYAKDKARAEKIIFAVQCLFELSYKKSIHVPHVTPDFFRERVVEEELRRLTEERDEARYNSRILAHAYMNDNRPPTKVVEQSFAYPVIAETITNKRRKIGC